MLFFSVDVYKYRQNFRLSTEARELRPRVGLEPIHFPALVLPFIKGGYNVFSVDSGSEH